MIELHELHFRYHNSPREVLDNVTLHFPASRIVGLLGKNGTGKSTLLYLMAGLLRPQQGEVLFEQRPVCDRTPAVLADLFVVPEHIELPAMKLSRYVSLHRDFYPHFSDELLLENLRQFDLSPDVNFSTLSTGQLKRRISVSPSPHARAFSSWTNRPMGSTSLRKPSFGGPSRPA